MINPPPPLSVMTANNVTPFEVFKNFVEFYPSRTADRVDRFCGGPWTVASSHWS